MPILDGFAQPGACPGPCFCCGEKGHRASDPECQGKEGDFSKDAPEWFKRKVGKGSGNGKGEGKGKGKGKGKSKAGGNRNWKGKGDSGKPPCANWSKGNGYCKWADNCRFSHDGPKGGKRKSTSLATKGNAKKQKKQMMSMLVKVLDDVEETRNEPKEKLSTKEKLMQIVRGNGKLVGMVTSDIIDRNYVPSRPKPAGRIVLMIGGSAREKREYRPVDPRRPQQSRVVQSEADTMQSENEKINDEKVFDEEKCDKKFLKNLEQFDENKRIPTKRSLRQSKAAGVVKEGKEKHRNFGRKNRQEPLKSVAEKAILELPPAPFVLATALWDRGEISGQKRTKSGEKEGAKGRTRASKAYAKREEKQKQNKPKDPNAYPINTHPKSSLKGFDADDEP